MAIASVLVSMQAACNVHSTYGSISSGCGRYVTVSAAVRAKRVGTERLRDGVDRVAHARNHYTNNAAATCGHIPRMQRHAGLQLWRLAWLLPRLPPALWLMIAAAADVSQVHLGVASEQAGRSKCCLLRFLGSSE